MTLWAQKDFEIDRWQPVQDTFGSVWESAGYPSGMMLVSVRTDYRTERLIIALPDDRMLQFFAGFEAVGPSQLPRKATLLDGRNEDFEKQFSYLYDEPKR